MAFDDQITCLPRPYRPERGADAVAALPQMSPEVTKLLRGAAGCSTYLADLMKQEAAWLVEALADPLAALAKECRFSPEHAEHPKLGVRLRRSKRRVALMTALADLGGVWSLDAIMAQLTAFADAACKVALRAALAPQLARGKLPGLGPGQGPEVLHDAAGLCVFAMGKMGAGELNYSSDIDLICLFDETRFAPQDYADMRRAFVRAIQAMTTLLSERTADGYVFRTDLRLRPDPGATPVALSMGAAERYYESLGRSWERAAWIKARPCAGDIVGGQRFQDDLAPFVWRRHLDFAAIADAHDIRLAIRDAKGEGGAITLPGHDIKLGRGGIREIEFFAQTRQLIAGGRNPALRMRGTCAALGRLAEIGWVPVEQASALTTHYRYFRQIEHRLQMVQDAQTHKLPTNEDEFARLAAMMDTEAESLKADLRDRLEAVHAVTEDFFAPDAAPPARDTGIDPAALERWRRFPALRSARAQSGFERLLPGLDTAFKAATRPSEAIAAFEAFLGGLPAGVQIFALFDANPHLVDLLLDILTLAPPLAQYLGRNAQVLDAVLDGAFFRPLPDQAELEKTFAEHYAQAGDYEAVLDASRRAMKEWHFRIGVHLLRGLTDTETAERRYADLARALIVTLWPHVVAHFAQRHGPPPGRGAMVLGMGSLGARRMTPSSDLDLIVIYDAEAAKHSDGPKPLVPGVYFARLTQALVTALSAPTAEGRLYSVDMRLRPSGNQGPVATSLNAFAHYQMHEAWIWEHLALTRACPIAGSEPLRQDVERIIADALAAPSARDTVLQDVQDMRTRIAAARAPSSVWDVKTGPGRLQEIDLLVQAACLIQGRDAHDIRAAFDQLVMAGLTDAEEAAQLRKTHRLASDTHMLVRLVAGDTAQEAAPQGAGAQAALAAHLGASDCAAAERMLSSAFAGATRILDAALPGPRG